MNIIDILNEEYENYIVYFRIAKFDHHDNRIKSILANVYKGQINKSFYLTVKGLIITSPNFRNFQLSLADPEFMSKFTNFIDGNYDRWLFNKLYSISEHKDAMLRHAPASGNWNYENGKWYQIYDQS